MSQFTNPATRLQVVVLDTEYKEPRALYVGNTGNVSITDIDGNTVTLQNVQGGTILPIWFKRINTSGTSATGLVALF